MMLPERTLLHSRIYTAGLIFLSLGMLYSGPVASMSILLLGVNWFTELHYAERLRMFLKNRAAVLLCAVFLLHVIALSWSSDLDFGLNDVRIKVPLFVLPFILSTSPRLSAHHFRLFCSFFVLGVVVSTLISICVLKGVIPIAIHDIRDISIFVSHIRLSLMICLSVFILFYWIVKDTSSLRRILYSGGILWLVIFLIIIESLTGLSILLLVAMTLGIVHFNSYRPWLGRVLLIGVLVTVVLVIIQVLSVARSFTDVKPIPPSSLLTVTPGGNTYSNDTTSFIIENGTYVMVDVCWAELDSGWKKRSAIPFRHEDAKGNQVAFTLARYMASKGLLKKDAQTFTTLTDEDIRLVEAGVTNYKYKHLSSLNARIYETIWEMDVYLKGENPSGNSMTMRFEFWRAGWHIFKKHLLYGTGTGDVKNEFIKQYQLDHSKLSERWQLRGHNQYLSIAIAMGIPGLLLFLVSLIYPLVHNKMYRNYFYAVFWVILVISLITEDTFETQAGATFYALFNSVFLFARPEKG
jgi:hypothetical protein